MKKYKAGSMKQAAAIARRSTGWNDEERKTLQDIAEGRLKGEGFGVHVVFWCEKRRAGFLFHKIAGAFEVSKIYVK